MVTQRFGIGIFLESLIASVIVGIVIPCIFILKALFSGLEMEWNLYLTGAAFSFLVTFCIYYANIPIVQAMQKKEKAFRSQFIRVSLEMVLTMTISGIVMFVFYSLFAKYLQMDLADNHNNLYDNIVIALVVDVIVVTLMEVIFFFHKWKNSLIESEKLRRQNVEIQFAAITSQINPHFLFNSLNVLGSLIETDPEKAAAFTREFARIYRYVLDSNDRFVLPLAEELKFVRSYLFLQQIRFGNNLVVSEHLTSTAAQKFLPPLSLQLLIENAIKHNEISAEHPLQIGIDGQDDHITVTNNYRPLPKKHEEGGGFGLRNLTERYSHYTDRQPDFRVENGFYRATIPLLEDE